MRLIFYNGNVMTVDPRRPQVEAVAVENGTIAAVGGNDEVLALKTAETEVIDLAGRSLLPGFNDSHMHLIGHALTAAKVDLRYCTSIEDVIGTVEAFIRDRKVKKGEWVLGWGWDQSRLNEKRMPTRQDLDQVADEHPVMIMRNCCHICVSNTTALQKAGIDKHPRYVEGGTVATDAEGVPTGVLEENAMQLVIGLQPPLDGAKLKELIKEAAADFLAAGLTSVQTDDLAQLGSDLAPVLIDAYRELDLSSSLPIRVNLQPLLPTVEELQAFLDQGYRTGQGGEYFKIGPLKLLTDGSLGGQTALLSAPYEDNPCTCGVAVLSKQELQQLVDLAHRNGMQVAAHAIGDAAIGMVLDVYEEVGNRHPVSDPRFRVIHASLLNLLLLERFKTLGVLADIQPAFTSTDYASISSHIGDDRAAWAYRWKDLLDYGIKAGCGSDCPVENYAPLESVYSAVTRQDKSGNPPGGWFPDQKLTLEEAINIYTMGSAYCSYEERIKGSITPGKLADMVVLSEDITAADIERIKDIRVDMTIVGGKIAFKR